MKNIIKNVIVFVILFLAFTLVFSTNWVFSLFGNISIEEIIFQIRVPMTDANTDYYFNFATKALPLIVISTVGSFVLLNLIFKKRKKRFPKRMKGAHYETSETSLVVYKSFRIDFRFVGKLVISCLALVISINYLIQRTGLVNYINNQLAESSIIKDEYVDPKNVSLVFPENKRNVIYIYLESMESTFYSSENGGAYETSIIQDLEDLALENVAFSNSDTLKGLYSLPGTTWTTGAMVAQSLGLPLNIPIDNANSYDKFSSFLPGAMGIGEILKNQGYRQMIMMGSNSKFGGRDHLYQQHGDYEIYDFPAAVDEGKKKESDYIWWGFVDRDLFEYAKEKIVMLSEGDEPFNFTMLTVDTHTYDGFHCVDCNENFDLPYFNVLNCSARRVKSFIEWVQEQDFYENTTIVICGDHPSMQAGTFDHLNNEGYERNVVDIIINPAVMPENTKNKNASTFDMFPTTLASMGVKIDGEKLGLGTNLFSDKETLIEKYGLDNLKNELSKSSKFYNEQFLYEH